MQPIESVRCPALAGETHDAMRHLIMAGQAVSQGRICVFVQAAGSHFSADPAPPPLALEVRRRPWACLPCCRTEAPPPAADDILGKKWITVYDSIGNRCLQSLDTSAAGTCVMWPMFADPHEA